MNDGANQSNEVNRKLNIKILRFNPQEPGSVPRMQTYTLEEAHGMTLFMATLGLSYVIEGVAQLAWGTQVHELKLGISDAPLQVAGILVSNKRQGD